MLQSVSILIHYVKWINVGFFRFWVTLVPVCKASRKMQDAQRAMNLILFKPDESQQIGNPCQRFAKAFEKFVSRKRLALFVSSMWQT